MATTSQDTNRITADAVALQERDEFRAAGWLKLIAPAKVNLHLAIGPRRADGYHDAATVMHALALHDVVYLRRAESATSNGIPRQQGEERGHDGTQPDTAADIAADIAADTGIPIPAVRMVAGDPSIDVPAIPDADNLAARAITRLAAALDLPASATQLELRIEKNIPAQAGLGGGSSDAAAALVGAAHLWGIAPDHPSLHRTARALGADVAFFLRGGCAYLEGTGDTFVHALAPAKQAVVLVKPDGGVSTAEAYRQFDTQPAFATPDQQHAARTAQDAGAVPLFNNLAPAAETLMPQLADIRAWLDAQPGTRGALLCGSGACTFAPCQDFAAAAALAAAARKQGWWARTTALSSARALVVSGEGMGSASGASAGEAAGTAGAGAGEAAGATGAGASAAAAASTESARGTA